MGAASPSKLKCCGRTTIDPRLATDTEKSMNREVRFAKSGSIRIAYEVLGEEGPDLIFVPGFISNLDISWEDPDLSHFLKRLAKFARLVVFDKRGTGLSDRTGGMPTLEERMDDVRAVMDAAGTTSAFVLGVSEGGAMSMLFAATLPERCRGLVLLGAYAHFKSAVMSDEQLAASLGKIDDTWGTGASVTQFAPTLAGDDRFRSWWARFERAGASPSAVIELMRMNSEIDVRHHLSAIHVPTLVLHRLGDCRVKIEAGREIARNVPEAQLVELQGTDHVFWIRGADDALDVIETFVTGNTATVRSEVDRALGTVVFTDIVDSTKTAAAIGDRRWRSLLDRHDEIVRREVERFRGRVVDYAGDGVLSIFDGPSRAIRCAAAIVVAMGPLEIAVRAGVHTGELELRGDRVGGIAVHIGARVAGLANPGEVLISETVKGLIAGAGHQLRDRGTHILKGVPEEWRVFSVVS